MKDRFMSKVSPEPMSGCWLWTTGTHPFGYGLFWMDDNTIGAHRAAWMIFKGEIPNGMSVLHRCDVPECVNPDHLFLGTQGDNVRDCVAKGRNKNCMTSHPELICRGEQQGHSKLSTQDVLYIRSHCFERGDMARLGRMFGVTSAAIAMIIKRKNWRHI